MSPELSVRIASLTLTQRTELERVLSELEQRGLLHDLGETDLLALLDAVEEPPPLPTYVPAYELMDALTDREYRGLKHVLAPIAAQCQSFPEFYVQPIGISGIPAPFVAKVYKLREEWIGRFQRHGYNPND